MSRPKGFVGAVGGARRRPRVAPLVLAAALALAACGGGTKAPTPLISAPEPAVAPELVATPAGTVTSLTDGPDPEGLVVTADGTVALATRNPDRLALFDADGKLLRYVAVPGSARHLELAGPNGPVLVPGEDTALLSEVSLPAGVVLRSTMVGKQPHDATATSDGRVLVANEFGNSVSIVDNGAVIATLPGPLQPGGVAADGTRAAAVAVRGRLTYVYETSGGKPDQVGTVPAGVGPTHAIDLGGGVIAVADTTGGAILVTRISGTPKLLATIPLAGRPYGMGVDLTRHRLWVATGTDNLVHELTITGTGDATTLTVGRSFPTVRQPNSVAVRASDGRVYVAGATTPGSLQVFDPGPG